MIREASFYERKEDLCQCRLCPHRCKLRQGQVGLCGARRNLGGRLIAQSYGQFSGIALDPIEKKPLRHFHPGTNILSAGNFGCNMQCDFCQNYHISQSQPRTEFFEPQRLVQIAAGIPGNLGVAFTYNEPMIAMEYLMDVAPLLRKAGLKTVLVTNGMVEPDVLQTLLPFIDAVNIDVKAYSRDFYRRQGGNLGVVTTNLGIIAAYCHVEVTTLIIPGENDQPMEIDGLAEWISRISIDIPYHLTRFFPKHRMTDKAPTPEETLYRLAKVAGRHLRHVYVGNL